MKKAKYLIYILLILTNSLLSQEVSRLIQAHSHNDYNRVNPLFDALNCGFISVEADIYLIEGELYVAHEKDEIVKSHTLKALYLDPLLEISRTTESKYSDIFPIILLVDIKTDALSTYKVLHNQLEKYKNYISKYVENKKEKKLVDVIISGNRPKEFITAQSVRYVAIDGRLDDIEKDNELYPLISCSVESLVNAEMEKDTIKIILSNFAMKVQKQNKISRLWGVPDKKEYWNLQMDAGLNLIGTDNPRALMQFFSGKEN